MGPSKLIYILSRLDYDHETSLVFNKEKEVLKLLLRFPQYEWKLETCYENEIEEVDYEIVVTSFNPKIKLELQNKV